jgi:hypothetical protein
VESRTVEEIDYPKTKDEWWLLLDHHASELEDLVSNFHPRSGNDHDFAITAPMAEQACEVVRREIRSERTSESPLDQFRRMRKNRDPEMCSLLNKVWFGLPESTESRYQAGFGVLCDLCSEGGVLYEGEEYQGEAS